MGANVLVEFKIFFNWGHFFTIGGKKLFLDRENQPFWELYGPLVRTVEKGCEVWSVRRVNMVGKGWKRVKNNV